MRTKIKIIQTELDCQRKSKDLKESTYELKGKSGRRSYYSSSKGQNLIVLVQIYQVNVEKKSGWNESIEKKKN